MCWTHLCGGNFRMKMRFWVLCILWVEITEELSAFQKNTTNRKSFLFMYSSRHILCSLNSHKIYWNKLACFCGFHSLIQSLSFLLIEHIPFSLSLYLLLQIVNLYKLYITSLWGFFFVIIIVYVCVCKCMC